MQSLATPRTWSRVSPDPIISARVHTHALVDLPLRLRIRGSRQYWSSETDTSRPTITPRLHTRNRRSAWRVHSGPQCLGMVVWRARLPQEGAQARFASGRHIDVSIVPIKRSGWCHRYRGGAPGRGCGAAPEPQEAVGSARPARRPDRAEAGRAYRRSNRQPHASR